MNPGDSGNETQYFDTLKSQKHPQDFSSSEESDTNEKKNITFRKKPNLNTNLDSKEQTHTSENPLEAQSSSSKLSTSIVPTINISPSSSILSEENNLRKGFIETDTTKEQEDILFKLKQELTETYRRKSNNPDSLLLDRAPSVSNLEEESALSDLDWSLGSLRFTMDIRNWTRLVPEYNGEEKTLDAFIKKINMIWTHIEVNDRAQFLLILQLKLTDKAAEAVQDNEYETWPEVRQALTDHIIPYRNTEKSELKLVSLKQKFNEDVESFAKRIESALDTLNRSFPQEEQNEVIKRENDRKARKAFENGLNNSLLRSKAIAKSGSTLRESVDYIIEQELRHSELRPVNNNSAAVCGYCKLPGHRYESCRKRTQNRGQNSNRSNYQDKKEIICFKSGRKNHYANECRSASSAGSSNSKSQNENNTKSSDNKRNYNIKKKLNQKQKSKMDGEKSKFDSSPEQKERVCIEDLQTINIIP